MDEIRVIRPQPAARERQHLDYFLGVSGETCGATGLAMHLVVARNDANEQERVVPYGP
jgi:uncharacterized RmlC-like cupin family protein